MGVTLTTCGGIPETGTAPLGGRFLLVTNAQENGCRKTEHRRNFTLWPNSCFHSTAAAIFPQLSSSSECSDLPCFLLERRERVRRAQRQVLSLVWWLQGFSLCGLRLCVHLFVTPASSRTSAPLQQPPPPFRPLALALDSLLALPPRHQELLAQNYKGQVQTM